MAFDHGMSEPGNDGKGLPSHRSETPESSHRLIGGRYRLVAAIGEGSTGRVWRARDELLDRDVALKEILFLGEFGETEKDELKKRQLREARSAARLSHPAVATVFDVVKALGRPWIVMEFVRGRSLDRILEEQGPLQPHIVARIGQDVLAAAHVVSVLHRDVKPSNVLLTRDGGAVLTDFGVATIEGGLVTISRQARPAAAISRPTGSGSVTSASRRRSRHSGVRPSAEISMTAVLRRSRPGVPARRRLGGQLTVQRLQLLQQAAISGISCAPAARTRTRWSSIPPPGCARS
jgi:eukaryotic-like serine/threonine-protein kinase